MLRIKTKILALALAAASPPAFGQGDPTQEAITRTFVDDTRPIKASMGFAGSDTRRLDVTVWSPIDSLEQTKRPLVIYSHGTFGSADNAMHIVRALVDAGYIVAAPDYPLTSSKAFTKVRFADISDVAQQVRDVGFMIDSLLADPKLGPRIDADRIGLTGHSLGGVTSYFAAYGGKIREPRVRAIAPIGAGDPVQSALSSDMGLYGTPHSAASVPVLFLSAEKDIFARTTGGPGAAFARVNAPKYEVMVTRGTHVWFRDGNDRPAGNKNPDCLFFERNVPNVAMPGCEERVPLIDPARQQEIARHALISFFDAYLKGSDAALGKLKRISTAYPEASLVMDEGG